jgi:hypothetical protein
MLGNELGEVQKDTSAENSKLLELRALRVQEDKIEEAYRQIFPKVDPFPSTRFDFAYARRPHV